MSIRTDLAVESTELYREELRGIESTQKKENGITVTYVKITDDEASQKIGKPIGSYITIELDSLDFENEDMVEKASNAVKNELYQLIDKKAENVLVVGLGNQYITPDSIGPKTVSDIFVTRHLKDVKEIDFDFRSVSAVAPGVLGLTGIETGEIVSGVAKKVSPDLIIAVDALASRSIKRLGTTIQISDTGINPGSGVGNNRKELSEKSLGVPVIAIGVPMVVDAVTISEDIIDYVNSFCREYGGEEVFGIIGKMSAEDRTAIIRKALPGKKENIFVTPNDVDVISEQASKIIAKGINKLLNEDIF